MPSMLDMAPNLMDAVIQTESNWKGDAYNKKSGATGLGQITPIALEDFNTLKKEKLTMADMKDPQKNMYVTDWTLNYRIPSMLRTYKLPLTIDNVLTAYNFGIGNLKKGKELPAETISYIKKVKKNMESMAKSQVGGM